VSAGEQTYTLSAVADLIDAGVRMVQPDIIKMGGITGLQRCIALTQAHGVELVPHQTQPTGQYACRRRPAACHQAVRAERSLAAHARRLRQSTGAEGRAVHLPGTPGLGLTMVETELAQRQVALTA